MVLLSMVFCFEMAMGGGIEWLHHFEAGCTRIIPVFPVSSKQADLALMESPARCLNNIPGLRLSSYDECATRSATPVCYARSYMHRRAKQVLWLAKPIEAIELPCPSTQPKCGWISRSLSTSIACPLPVSCAGNSKRFLQTNQLTTLPFGVFDALGSLTIL